MLQFKKPVAHSILTVFETAHIFSFINPLPFRHLNFHSGFCDWLTVAWEMAGKSPCEPKLNGSGVGLLEIIWQNTSNHIKTPSHPTPDQVSKHTLCTIWLGRIPVGFKQHFSSFSLSFFNLLDLLAQLSSDPHGPTPEGQFAVIPRECHACSFSAWVQEKFTELSRFLPTQPSGRPLRAWRLPRDSELNDSGLVKWTAANSGPLNVGQAACVAHGTNWSSLSSPARGAEIPQRTWLRITVQKGFLSCSTL